MSQRPLARAALNGSESRATDPSVPVGPLSEWTYRVSQRPLVRAALNGSESRATGRAGRATGGAGRATGDDNRESLKCSSHHERSLTIIIAWFITHIFRHSGRSCDN
jgi:hypothetical protein